MLWLLVWILLDWAAKWPLWHFTPNLITTTVTLRGVIRFNNTTYNHVPCRLSSMTRGPLLSIYNMSGWLLHHSGWLLHHIRSLLHPQSADAPRQQFVDETSQWVVATSQWVVATSQWVVATSQSVVATSHASCYSPVGRSVNRTIRDENDTCSSCDQLWH